ncbi:DUF2339 domain-containing protein [Acetobacter cerevisiae]|uniref:hypothetical protein n=1 Tax=Acetobacter cerevisiae TaxID=178900 RepID=UPI000785770F|nr:hypothetical protein [Acetobacter cerevisiae]
MTLAVILAPLLALCVVARGIGFLPALGVVTAVAMLVDAREPLQEFGAVCVVLFSVLPVWFVSRYQDDGARERTGPMVPFLALGLMVILQLATGTPAAMGEAPGHAGAAYLPAGLCVALAGLVAVTCRQAMVWQWAGLLACVDGVMLSGVIENQVMVVGVTALAGCVVALLGGMCVHRVMLRVAVAPAQDGAGAERPSARSAGFELGDVEPTGPEPRGLGPEAVVAPRIWTEAEAAAEDEEPLPRPDKAAKKAAPSDGDAKADVDQPPVETGAPQDKRASDAETVASDDDAETVKQKDVPDASHDTAKPTETESTESGVLKTDSSENALSEEDAEERKTGMDPVTPAAEASRKTPEHTSDTASSSPADQPEPFGPEEKEPEAEPVPRTPEMIARDVWLRGYLTERGRDA